MNPARETDRLLRTSEVLKLVGFQKSALYVRLSKNQFPQRIKLGRMSVWPASEVQAWIERQKASRAEG